MQLDTRFCSRLENGFIKSCSLTVLRPGAGIRLSLDYYTRWGGMLAWETLASNRAASWVAKGKRIEALPFPTSDYVEVLDQIPGLSPLASEVEARLTADRFQNFTRCLLEAPDRAEPGSEAQHQKFLQDLRKACPQA